MKTWIKFSLIVGTIGIALCGVYFYTEAHMEPDSGANIGGPIFLFLGIPLIALAVANIVAGLLQSHTERNIYYWFASLGALICVGLMGYLIIEEFTYPKGSTLPIESVLIFTYALPVGFTALGCLALGFIYSRQDVFPTLKAPESSKITESLHASETKSTSTDATHRA